MPESLPAQGTYALLLVTAVISAAIAFFLKEYGRTLLYVIFYPIILLCRFVYQRTAYLNPFSLSLHTYKHRIQRSSLAYMENPVGPALQVPLERAFSPLRLISTERQETIEFFPYVADCNRIIVLGGPGSGKTTIMKSLVISIIRKKCHPSLNNKIPAFIVLRELASAQHTVKDAIVASFEHHYFPKANKVVESAIKNGRLVIVMDGLDEVGDQRPFVVEQIQKFCSWDAQRNTPNHVLVTCREYSYQSEELRSEIPNAVRVEEFSDHHMRTFLKGWPLHQGRSALNLLSLIQANPQVHLVCRNPLILTILTGLYLLMDQFELPKTRNKFLDEAVSELLEKRPHRRGQVQQYKSDDKLNLLARVSLERIENTDPRQDPEKISRYDIQEHAQAVMHCEVNIRDLEYELVDINGILKPIGDGFFTFNHRTFQEFFAAREANRVRDVEDVLAAFSYRPSLSEILKLYCGLLTNVPQVNKVMRTFIERQDWLQGAECLLNMVEIPNKALVEELVAGLYASARRVDFSTATNLRAVEILSHLSMQRHPAFSSAQTYFARILESITAEEGGQGKPVLIELLFAKNPEAAERLIPALVHNGPAEWRRAAVRALRDLGTEKAMDDLVRLLNDEPSPEREEAARLVAGLVTSNRSDMVQRAPLVADHNGSMRDVWPLERYFPGRLILAIVDAAGNSEIDDEAIQLAKTVREGAVNGLFQHRRASDNWRQIGWALRKEAIRWTLVPWSPVCILAIFFLSVVTFGAYLYQGKSYLAVMATPFRYVVFDRQEVAYASMSAFQVVDSIKRSFPPNASGIDRVLPWNWVTEPVLPSDEAQKVFEDMGKISTSGAGALSVALSNRKDGKPISARSLNAFDDDLQKKLTNIFQTIDREASIVYGFDAIVCIDGVLQLLVWIYPILMSTPIMFRFVRLAIRQGDVGERVRKSETQDYVTFSIGSMWIASAIFFVSNGFLDGMDTMGIVAPTWILIVFYLLPAVIAFAVGGALRGIPWSLNPYLDTARTFVYGRN